VSQHGYGRRNSVPEGLGDILGREVKRVTGEKRDVERARAKWIEVVGPALAPQTAVVAYRANVLRVRVESSALMQELAGIYKKELIAAMASGADPVAVRTIEFELAGGA
jgi:predicted nucleic acid-binding Zn ribbon protein